VFFYRILKFVSCIRNHLLYELVHCAVFEGKMKARCFRDRIDLILRKKLKKHLPFPTRRLSLSRIEGGTYRIQVVT